MKVVGPFALVTTLTTVCRGSTPPYPFWLPLLHFRLLHLLHLFISSSLPFSSSYSSCKYQSRQSGVLGLFEHKGGTKYVSLSQLNFRLL
jgi:hypothetical protein